MKKKLLLGLLPALLALSACGGASPNDNDADTFLEDTTAHTELFGDAKEVKAVRNVDPDPLPALSTPKMGYQIKYADGKLAIRFVAGIKDTYAKVKAEWKRGVAGANGETLRAKSFNDAAQESENFYTTLKNGAGETQYTAGSGEFEGYTGFVVYTLYNIPYDANKNAYVAAYLTLTDKDNEENIATSKVLAVKIEKASNTVSKNYFSFDSSASDGKHFLQGTINGKTDLVYATENPGGNNFAAYYGVELLTTDTFGSFYFRKTQDGLNLPTFQYFGFNDYFQEEPKYYDSASEDAGKVGSVGYATPRDAGTYNLYLSSNDGKHNHVYTANGHIWTYAFGSAAPARLNACEEGGQTKYYIEGVSVTSGDALHLYKDGVEDSTVYSVKENVSNNNIYTSKAIKNSGTANIYLNTDGGIWVSVPNTAYKRINMNLSDWDSANAIFHAWSWKNDGDGGSWYSATIGEGHAATLDIPNHCDRFILVRHNTGSDPSLTIGGDIWNKTDNVEIMTGTFTITGWNENSYKWVS